MKLLSWNVNGYRAALKKGFGDFLLGSGADVLGLQEVKSTPDQLAAKDTAFPGYKCAWNGAERKGYSGVAAFYAKAPLAVTNGLGDRRFDGEAARLGAGAHFSVTDL